MYIDKLITCQACSVLLCTNIKTHGIELQGQEEAARIMQYIMPYIQYAHIVNCSIRTY